MKFEIGEYRTRAGTFALISAIAKAEQDYPLVGLYYDEQGRVHPECWDLQGKRFQGEEHDYDLVLPKVTIWINVWKRGYTEAYDTKYAADNDLFDGTGELRAGCIEFTFED